MSGAGELPPRALAEPYVRLSSHTAPIIRSHEPLRTTLPCSPAPSSRLTTEHGRMTRPLCSTGITPLHRYYESLRPRAAHWYSRPVGCIHPDFSLSIATTGSHVPHKSLNRTHAASTPEAARAVNGTPPELVPAQMKGAGFDLVSNISTPHRSVRFRSSFRFIPDPVRSRPFP